MVTKTAATPEASLGRQKIAKLLDQYGCGPVRFSGTNDALYERHLLAEAVANGRVERGVAICGSGVGASVCANKIPGIRAALIHDHFSARQGVEDDHINIICLGGRTDGPAVAWDLVQTFLTAEFSQEERHLRRLAKVASREQQGETT